MNDRYSLLSINLDIVDYLWQSLSLNKLTLFHEYFAEKEVAKRRGSGQASDPIQDNILSTCDAFSTTKRKATWDTFFRDLDFILLVVCKWTFKFGLNDLIDA